MLSGAQEDECRKLAEELKDCAVNGLWDQTIRLLCEQAAPLVINEDVLRSTGIGRVVGRLRAAIDPTVAAAAADVIEGWRFQISLETPVKPIVMPLTRRQPELNIRRITTTTDECRNQLNNLQHHNELSIAQGRTSDEQRLEVAGDELIEHTQRRSDVSGLAVGLSHLASASATSLSSQKELDFAKKLRNSLAVHSSDEGSDSNEQEGSLGSETDEDTFVAMPVLDQCEILTRRINRLLDRKDDTSLLRLLKKQVAPLLVTEDDLRCSGFGKLMSKIVKQSTNSTVRMKAQTIINEWRMKIRHRDPILEREDEIDRKNRQKFEDFMVFFFRISLRHSNHYLQKSRL